MKCDVTKWKFLMVEVARSDEVTQELLSQQGRKKRKPH